MNQYAKIFVALLLGVSAVVRSDTEEVSGVATELVTTPPTLSSLTTNQINKQTDGKYQLLPDAEKVSIFGRAVDTYPASSTKIRTTGFDESALDYRCGGDFCVWWDKRFDHAENAEDTLRWANLSLSKCIERDMRLPKGYNTYYLNIYLHHKGNEGAGEDIFPDNWGQGVGGDLNDVPMTVFPYPKEKVQVDPKKPYADLPHEVFHICQYSKANYDYNYHLGEGHYAGWIIESAAMWFQFKMLSYDEVNHPGWYGAFYAAETVSMQPQLSIWGGVSEMDGTWRSWSFGVHRYGMHILLTYLDRLGYLDDNFVYDMFGMPTTTGNPQKDIYNAIINFPEAYRKFAMNMVSLDFLTPNEKVGFIQMSKWWDDNIGDLDGKGDFKNDFNRYVAVLKDSGTQGYISPLEKNQAWSWTVMKIENTAPASYKIDFDGDLIGDNGTKSDFYVGTFMEGVAQRYGEIPLINQKGSGAISVPKNTTAYVVVVNTPYSFEGSETFNYKIKIERTAESVTYPIAVKTNGSGVVVSNPAGINCGSICTATFTGGTSVSLTASPTDGHSFNGWSGACSGGGACTVTMDAAKSVTATFTENGSGPIDPIDPDKPYVKSIIPSSTAIVKKPFTIGWQLNQIQNKMPVRVKFAKDGGGYRVIKSAKANATGIGSYRWKPTKAHRTGEGLLQICAIPSKGAAEVCSPSASITVQ